MPLTYLVLQLNSCSCLKLPFQLSSIVLKIDNLFKKLLERVVHVAITYCLLTDLVSLSLRQSKVKDYQTNVAITVLRTASR